MAKRRTKKEKINPHHRLTISWQPEAEKTKLRSSVKGQFTRGFEAKSQSAQASKNADPLALNGTLPKVKANIVRSLLLVSFILALELVLYLAWH